jgi:hypothetical protein
MKLTPGVDFTNVLRAAFALKDPNSTKKLMTVFLRFWNLGMKNMLIKHWRNRPQSTKEQSVNFLSFFP